MEKSQAERSKTLIIASMHRSGSSLTAALLQSAGLHIGRRLMEGGGANIKGHFENLDFYNFHQQVLKSQLVNEDGWTLQEPIHVDDYYREEAKNLVAKNAISGLWGWKEPRTTLFLEFWANLLPEANFLMLFRYPWEVVSSLYRKGKVYPIFQEQPELAIKFWLHYNQKILNFYNSFPERCFLVSLNNCLQNTPSCIDALNQKFRINLAVPNSTIYQPSLLHREDSEGHRASLISHYYPEAIALYHELEARAWQLTDTLDTSWQEKLKSSPYRVWAFQDWVKVGNLQGENQKLQQELGQTQSQLHQSEEVLGQTQSQLHQTQEELGQTQSQLHHTESQLHQSEEVLGQTQSQLHQTQEELGQTQSQLHHTEDELGQIQSQLEERKTQFYQTEAMLSQYQFDLQQVETLLEQSQTQLHQKTEELEKTQGQLHQTQAELDQTQSQLHQTQAVLEQSQAQLYETEAVLEQSVTQLQQKTQEWQQSQSQLHQVQEELERSQSQLHQTQAELGQTQSQLHQTEEVLERWQSELHQTQQGLEETQSQLHQTEEVLEQSQAQLHETEAVLEQSMTQLQQKTQEWQQSQSQLHQTQEELERSQSQLHQTQELLEQSQAQLHETEAVLEQSVTQLQQKTQEWQQSQSHVSKLQEELERSQSQLHQTQEELERLEFEQTVMEQTHEPKQLKYKLLLRDAWLGYRQGDMTQMRRSLQESMKFTPFSRTETVSHWSETFAQFSEQRGESLDIYALTSSPAWKQSIDRAIGRFKKVETKVTNFNTTSFSKIEKTSKNPRRSKPPQPIENHQETLRFSVDRCLIIPPARLSINGWVDPRPEAGIESVEVRLDGQLIQRSKLFLLRPDVAQCWGDERFLASGWSCTYDFPGGTIPLDAILTIKAIASNSTERLLCSKTLKSLSPKSKTP